MLSTNAPALSSGLDECEGDSDGAGSAEPSSSSSWSNSSSARSSTPSAPSTGSSAADTTSSSFDLTASICRLVCRFLPDFFAPDLGLLRWKSAFDGDSDDARSGGASGESRRLSSVARLRSVAS